MTDEEFSAWWSILKQSLNPHTAIPYWSAAKGYREETFTVSVPAMSPECVVVEKGKIYQRMVFVGNFQDVLEIWDDYRDGVIARRDVDAVTNHSTYVIGIIRWLEDKSR